MFEAKQSPCSPGEPLQNLLNGLTNDICLPQTDVSVLTGFCLIIGPRGFVKVSCVQ